MTDSVFMTKLLQSVEVEWKPLWQVTSWDKRFNAVNNDKQARVIKYHYLLANEIKPLIVDGGTVKLLTTNVSNLWTTEELAGEIVSEGEVIAIPWGGNVIVQYYKGKFLTSDNRIATSNDVNILNNKYLYYFLLNNIELLSSYYRGSGIKHPNMSKVLDILIPIPSLKIQVEIVRMLDNFTELTAKLIAELTARKKQYNYYRDELLTFEEDEIEWKALGEIGEFVRGNGLQKSDFTENGIGCIHYGQIYTYYGNFAYQTKSFVSPVLATKLRKAKKGDLIIATTSENIEDVCKTLVWLGEDEVCVSGETYIFKHNQSAKYLAYYLQTPMFFDYKKQNRTGTKVIRVHGDKLAKFLVPIPPLAEQERIVSILDKFDALTNSITEGLPREIELRQKQYEYYRDMLLSFPKPEVEA